MEVEKSGSGALLEWVSWLATVCTVGLFSAGIWTCRKIHATRSVGTVPHLPFIAASVNCSLWMTYGFIKPDSTIAYVNLVGLLLQLSYTLVYHTYAEIKFKVQRDFLVALALVISIIGYFSLLAPNSSSPPSPSLSSSPSSVTHLGMVCSFFTILFFASPLSTMNEVIRSKSTDSMSFLLSVMSVACTFSWVIYGVLVRDTYVILPNTIGLLLACVQISLFFFYGKTASRPGPTETPIV